MNVAARGWKVELPRIIRYENLQDFDYSGLVFSIEVDEFRDDTTDYFLSSPHIDIHEDPVTALSSAREVCLLVNGIFDIFDIPPILKLSSHDMRYDATLQKAGRFTVRPTPAEFNMPYKGIYPQWRTWRRGRREYVSSESSNFCILCLMDERIRNIALTFGYLGVNWISLYAAKEHLSLPDAELSSKFQVPIAGIRLFNSTANNFSVLGPAGRHGERNWLPPANPMPFADAKELVLKLVRGEARAKVREGDFQNVVREIFSK